MRELVRRDVTMTSSLASQTQTSAAVHLQHTAQGIQHRSRHGFLSQCNGSEPIRDTSTKTTTTQVSNGWHHYRYMFHNFFNGEAYTADIAAIRKIHPKLLNFEQYLRKNGWENLPVLPIPQQGAW